MSKDNQNFLQSSGGIIVAILLVVVSFTAGAMYMKWQNEKDADNVVLGEQTDDNNDTSNNNNPNSQSDVETFYTYAEDLGLEMGEYKKCLTDGQMKNKLVSDVVEGSFVMGTPAFAVNGKKVEIDQTVDKTWFDAIKRYVDAELSGSPLAGTVYDISVTDNDPQKGNKNASVIVAEFSDLQCPACASGGKPAAEQVISAYGDKVNLVWKNFPLGTECNVNVTSAFHEKACIASEAAMCAFEQGKFWEMHDLLFENQSTWTK